MFLEDPPDGPAVHELYDIDIGEDGYISNSTRAWAWRPDVFRAFKRLREINGEAMSLNDAEFALVIAATVAERSDSYCSMAWGRLLAQESDDAVAAEILSGGTPSALTAREAALVSWARMVASAPNGTRVSDLTTLREVGLSDRDIFEVTALVAFRIAYSTVNAALGVQPDPELAAAAPHRVREIVGGYGRPAAQ